MSSTLWIRLLHSNFARGTMTLTLDSRPVALAPGDLQGDLDDFQRIRRHTWPMRNEVHGAFESIAKEHRHPFRGPRSRFHDAVCRALISARIALDDSHTILKPCSFDARQKKSHTTRGGRSRMEFKRRSHVAMCKVSKSRASARSLHEASQDATAPRIPLRETTSNI